MAKLAVLWHDDVAWVKKSNYDKANRKLKKALDELGQIGTGIDPRSGRKMEGCGNVIFFTPFESLNTLCRYAFEVRDKIRGKSPIKDPTGGME